MSTGGGEVAIVISARDRASPVMQRVGRNLNVLQRNTLSVASSMGVISGATRSVVGSMIPMVGSFGAAGIAISGMTFALNLGVKRLKDMQEQQRNTGAASQRLRSNLILSGFSASTAAARVDDLRGSMSRLSFQAVPRLSFEMQQFFGGLDKDSKQSLGQLADALSKALGLKTAEEVQTGLNAIGEAAQGNFGPISALLRKNVNSMAEVEAAIGNLGKQAVIGTNPILIAFQNLITGTGTFEERVEALRKAVLANAPILSKTFTEHGGIISEILSGLSNSELAYVRSNAVHWDTKTVQDKAARRVFIEEVGKIHTALVSQTTAHAEELSKSGGKWTLFSDVVKTRAREIELAALAIEIAMGRIGKLPLPPVPKAPGPPPGGGDEGTGSPSAPAPGTPGTNPSPVAGIGTPGTKGPPPVPGAVWVPTPELGSGMGYWDPPPAAPGAPPPATPGAPPRFPALDLAAIRAAGPPFADWGFIIGNALLSDSDKVDGILQRMGHAPPHFLSDFDQAAQFWRDYVIGQDEVPQFAGGGIVPGPIGAPVHAIVHGGEEVIPMWARGTGASPTTVIVQLAIGDRVFDEKVIEVLDGRVRITEPRLGLG